MSEKDLVSVVIPTYKRNRKLIRAINSVLKQTYDKFEILVVNDYKNNNTVIKLIEEFNDNRIKYFVNERKKGANGARNTGILNARGEYIAFLDDDDEWLPKKLESHVNVLKSKNYSWGGIVGAYLISYNNKWKCIKYKGSQDFVISDFLLDKKKICSGSNLLIKKDIIEKVGLWDEDLFRQQDLEFLIRILNKFFIAYDDYISVRIYGHNKQNPLKAFTERGKYIKKISCYLENLTQRDLNKFYSAHFRRQTYYLIMQRDYKRALRYWMKAREYKSFSFRKDIKNLSLVLKNIIF